MSAEIGYPYLLPTSMTLTITDNLLVPNIVQLRHATLTIEHKANGEVMFTYSKDSLLNVASCNNFPYKMWNNLPNRPSKYTEVTFTSNAFPTSATLLMCDTFSINAPVALAYTLTLTITETVIGN